MAMPIIIIFNITIMSIRMLIHCFFCRSRDSHNCNDEYDSSYNTILKQLIFNSINLICHERTDMFMIINKCLYTRTCSIAIMIH